MLTDLAKCEPLLALCSPCNVSLLWALGAALVQAGPVKGKAPGAELAACFEVPVVEACGGSTGTEYETAEAIAVHPVRTSCSTWRPALL